MAHRVNCGTDVKKNIRLQEVKCDEPNYKHENWRNEISCCLVFNVISNAITHVDSDHPKSIVSVHEDGLNR